MAIPKIEYIEGFVGQNKKTLHDDPWPMLYKALETGEILQEQVSGIEHREDKRPQLIINFGSVRGVIEPEDIGENLNTKASLVGQVIAFKVKSCNRASNTVYLTRKAALDEMAERTWAWLNENAKELLAIHANQVKPLREELANTLPKDPKSGELRARLREVYKESAKLGPKVTGVVRWVTAKAAYIDIGGVIAYLPVTEATWSIQQNCRNVLHPGDALDVKIIDVDPESKQVLVSAKALMPDPWDHAAEKYRTGGLYSATIKRLAEKYVVCELEPGIVGLAYRPPFEEMAEEDKVVVKVLSLDIPNRRAHLTIHRLLAKGV